MNVNGMLMAILGLVIGITAAALLLPTALVSWFNSSNWTGVPASITGFSLIIGIVAMVALILILLRRR